MLLLYTFRRFKMEKKQYINVETVKSLMAEKGIDEKTMANLMGLTPPTIRKFLNGADQKHYTAFFLYKLAKALGVLTADILYKDL